MAILLKSGVFCEKMAPPLSSALKRMKRVGRENRKHFFYKVTEKGRVIGKEIEENIFSEIRGRSLLAAFGGIAFQFGEGMGKGREDDVEIFSHAFGTSW